MAGLLAARRIIQEAEGVPKDVLSDNVFRYDKDTRKLETIRSELAREVRDDNIRS